MSEQIYWYTARASGIVALALVTASVVWGLLFSTRLLEGRPSPKWLLSLHRHLGGLAVAFTAVHIAGLVADSYVAFGPSEILVPFASQWQPEAVAWGVVGMYVLGAVEITSLLKKRLPRSLWRWVHLSSYALFWMSVVHGSSAGTDAASAAYRLGSRSAVILVVFLSVYRILTKRQVRGRAARSADRKVACGRLEPGARGQLADRKLRRPVHAHPGGSGLADQIAAAPRTYA